MSDDKKERLAAWLDGEMPSEDSRRLETQLKEDPQFAALAERWRANDQVLAQSFAPIADTPIEDSMLARLGLGSQSFIPANDNRPWWRRHSLLLGAAFAATLAMVVILLPRGEQVVPDPVSLALETTPSLTKARLPNGIVIEPTLTVRANDGRWCREFRKAEQIGLACRERNGWAIQAMGRGTGPASSDTIAVASGGDSSTLDAAYARIGAGDPIDAKTEAAVIARHWQAH